MSRPKKSKAVPVVTAVFILIAALAVICFLINPLVIKPQRDAIREADARAKAEVDEANRLADIEYQKELSELESKRNNPTYPDWPEPTKTEGLEVIDLSNIPLEHPKAETLYRSQLMYNGMLLVNPWHSRPADFDESMVTSVNRAYGTGTKIAKDNNVMLLPAAIEALREVMAAAKEAGQEHYLVDEGFRSYAYQEEIFNKRMAKYSSKYEGDALEAAVLKEVNRPGCSEYNSGLSFDLRLYDKDDPDVAVPKYSTTAQAKWMNENCWRYGLVFRFPQNAWPLETSTDKSFKTGVSAHLNLYRYVGKGNSDVMQCMDFTMEEYIEYLQEHPHIAVYEDGKLKYEIYRQVVGDQDPINVQVTASAVNYESSLDNMGAVITVLYPKQ